MSVLSVTTSLGTGEAAPAAIKVVMNEYAFRPERITVRAGQSVTLTLVNASTQKKLHEFMVGRVAARDAGNRPAGYERDFFDHAVIKVSNARGIWQLKDGDAKVSGEKKAEIAGMAMAGHGGFMVELKAGGTATLSFTVAADRVGVWEIGCFSEAGDHYTKGMKAKLVVVK
jgi:plastocyanin